ncbi:MAG: hypothetical protein JST75_11885 [Bacteroidetes bacterium]|nr:hypothetical protein [Bacteroidota bacterium]
MRKTKTVIIFFVVILLFLVGQEFYVHAVYKTNLNILGLEVADRADGGMILYNWWGMGNNGAMTIQHARINTFVDFLFIIAYVSLMRIISWKILEKENSSFFKNLLRLNIILAIVTGVLDVFENVIMLYNLTNYYPGEYYISSMYASYAKWFLVIWIILVWLVSLIKRRMA